jgi:two-component system cell cycle response regulator
MAQGRRNRQTTVLWGIGIVAALNVLAITWILSHPFSKHVYVTGVDVFEILGALAGGLWCLGASLHSRRNDETPRSIMAPALAGIALICYSVGQAVYAYSEVVQHVDPPFPGVADVFFLAIYPLLLTSILLLPARPLPFAVRMRVTLDCAMIMTAVIAFSWYFILGPTMLQGSQTLLGRIVALAYPSFDLMLVFAVLLLASRTGTRSNFAGVAIFLSGLIVFVIGDSLYLYRLLQNSYHTGSMMDETYVLGNSLIGLGAGAIHLLSRSRSAEDTGGTQKSNETPPLWRLLLPYALFPALMALLLYTRSVHADKSLERGVLVSSMVLVGLILARQVLAIRENHQLNQELMAYAERMEGMNTELHATQADLHVNVEALTRANERLQSLATTDTLTGLPNHRAMVAALEAELERSDRYGRPCSVMFFDLDHFKALNDSCGHPAGDAALAELAALVRGHLRSIDTVARWGGEEFLVLMPETQIDDAQRIGEQIRALVAGHTFSPAGGLRLTCSIGVASFPQDGRRRDTLVVAADQAMYAAKKLGRNQVRCAGDPAVGALLSESDEGSREETALRGTVEAMAALVSARDHYTGEHTEEVGNIAIQIAQALGLDMMQARLVGLAARLHDIGKVAIPDSILHKPEQLDDQEWNIMRTHPVLGAEILNHVPGLRCIAPMVRAHHERWDGSGYPDRLRADQIPLGARIISVSDTYGAITTDRPYRAARDAAAARAEIKKYAGSQFDPAVVDALLQVLDEKMADRMQSAA